MDYFLHSQLITKLRIAGMNALFCLRIHIEIGPNAILGTATGTGVCLRALPLSKPLKIVLNDKLQLAKMMQNGSDNCKKVLVSIEKLSRVNTHRHLSENLLSIQSPYNFIRELPK